MRPSKILAALAFVGIGFVIGCADKPATIAPNTTSSAEQRPKDPVLGESIVGGTMFQNRLWLWSATGGLVAFDLDKQTREVIYEQGVISIRKDGGNLWILRSTNPPTNNKPPTDLVLSTWHDNGRVDLAAPEIAGSSAIVGLSIYRGRPLLLFRDFLQTLGEDNTTWHYLPLQGALRAFRATVSSPVADSLYVGSNVGEWGGGLQRLHIPTGIVQTIERKDTEEICSGPLNSQCDPITGIIPDPQNSHCVLASVGLMHMMEHGRVVRVCGDNVEMFFARKANLRMPDGNFIDRERAMFGLASSPAGAIWILGTRSLWNIADGRTTEIPLPRLESFQGLHLTRAMPGIVVVATTVNAAMSLSGATPLLIPAE